MSPSLERRARRTAGFPLIGLAAGFVAAAAISAAADAQGACESPLAMCRSVGDDLYCALPDQTEVRCEGPLAEAFSGLARQSQEHALTRERLASVLQAAVARCKADALYAYEQQQAGSPLQYSALGALISDCERGGYSDYVEAPDEQNEDFWDLRSTQEDTQEILAAGPSFPCANAQSEIEKSICHSETISYLDSRLAERYFDLRREAGDAERDALLASQRSWLSGDRAECGELRQWEQEPCLEASYRRRVQQLAALSGPASAAGPRDEAMWERSPEDWLVASLENGLFNCFDLDDPRQIDIGTIRASIRFGATTCDSVESEKFVYEGKLIVARYRRGADRYVFLIHRRNTLVRRPWEEWTDILVYKLGGETESGIVNRFIAGFVPDGRFAISERGLEFTETWYLTNRPTEVPFGSIYTKVRLSSAGVTFLERSVEYDDDAVR